MAAVDPFAATPSRPRCHLCEIGGLSLVPEYAKFRRVTSDCKPWPAGGQLGVCESCHTVQIVADESWRKEIQEIYNGYTIYYQGGGAEQGIFEEGSGAMMARSARLVARIKEKSFLPPSGRLLDFGCGNGSFLRSFGDFFPEWKLSGVEYDGKYRAIVESIPGVEQFFTGDINDVPGSFDVISLIHVLEHIEGPAQFLQSLRKKMNPGGSLVVELMNYVENPFELLIADHATRFDPYTIRRLLESAEFDVDAVETEWVPKEFSIISKNLPPRPGNAKPLNPDVSALLSWLDSVSTLGGSIADHSPCFGLFGTSIAATWLFSELEGKVAFFVDEDANRTGKKHFGLPILSPSQVSTGSDVYVSLPPKLSNQIARRLASKNVSYHAVPDMA